MHSVPVFLALSLLALAGMATANVLLPSLVKLHFPDRVGLMTSIYSTALAIGLTSASVLTVPISEAYDGWRSGLLAWSFTGRHRRAPLARPGRARPPARGRRGPVGLLDVARTRLGWLMALFFGLQSLQAYSIFGWFAELYRDAGFSAHTAGLLLGVITGVSIPLSFLIPSLVARAHDQTLVMCSVMACYPLGYLGLIIAPQSGAWLWAVLVGIGTTHLPADPHPDRVAGAYAGGHGCPVGIRPVGRLPDRRDRPVRRRPAQRALRRLDGAADRAAGADDSPALVGLAVVAAGVRRGRSSCPRTTTAAPATPQAREPERRRRGRSVDQRGKR